MNKVTSFFLFCSGADLRLLERAPTETSKYVGVGATVFFTGVFAFAASAYALSMVFENVVVASLLGMVWGLMIFNLDRFIVSSMRKQGSTLHELGLALPRLILAIIISIVIAKPLELKIFEKEIAPELVVIEQEIFTRQDSIVRSRYQAADDSLKRERSLLMNRLTASAEKRDRLVRDAQQEADGTGGSMRRNPGPIYKIKKADADRAQVEHQELSQNMGYRLLAIDSSRAMLSRILNRELTNIKREPVDGPAARLEALARISEDSSAIQWANVFILLLFIAIETAPVFVKLLAPKGPYDNLLRIEEHTRMAEEAEALARINSEAKHRAQEWKPFEQDYLKDRLDASLKN